MYDPASGASIDQQVDFVAFPIQLDYLISGRVFWEQTGSGASDVTLFTFGALSLTTQSDSAGNYAFRLTPEQFAQYQGMPIFLFAVPPGSEEARAVNSSDPRRYYITIGQTLQGGPGDIVDADWQLTGNPPVVSLGGQVTVDDQPAEGVRFVLREDVITKQGDIVMRQGQHSNLAARALEDRLDLELEFLYGLRLVHDLPGVIHPELCPPRDGVDQSIRIDDRHASGVFVFSGHRASSFRLKPHHPSHT